ncbi:hypothetical protein FEF26_05640 [Nesterenkonia salmonea]|uniref:Uncharacterized protein n=1 Tax=Nesterenkonia salmonea TaxID=1804987 RepID=A0A5R9BCC4_9MICC|nr:hypothetical protein [Nesterenkonia salmonea]TLP98274.1 hypothetical protein FEF26_05640 [Nesterenkonia salmonea]
MFASTPGVLSRASLILGVIITGASFLSLITILGFYFAGTVPHSGLYWAALWGFPLGFVLMCVYLLINLGRRRAQ